MWLVEAHMDRGEGSFWCLRCESSDSEAALPTLSDSKGATMSGLEGNLETTKEDGKSRGKR